MQHTWFSMIVVLTFFSCGGGGGGGTDEPQCRDPQLGGECNVIDQCGCAEDEYCMLRVDNVACEVREECSPTAVSDEGYGDVGDGCGTSGGPCKFHLFCSEDLICTGWCLEDADCTLEDSVCSGEAVNWRPVSGSCSLSTEMESEPYFLCTIP